MTAVPTVGTRGKPVAIVHHGQVQITGRRHEACGHPGRPGVADDVCQALLVEQGDSDLLPLRKSRKQMFLLDIEAMVNIGQQPRRRATHVGRQPGVESAGFKQVYARSGRHAAAFGEGPHLVEEQSTLS